MSIAMLEPALPASREWEDEYESEEFIRQLGQAVRQSARSGALRRVGLAAARSAAGSLGDIGAALGGTRGQPGNRVGGTIGAALGRILSDLVPENEDEAEWENPIRRAYPQAVMGHLGHAAASASSDREAEEFAAALVPLALRLAPHAASALGRAAPALARGAAAVARTLRADPTTRPLVQALPTIVQRTAASLARQGAGGRPVSVQQAVRTLSQQTARTLSNPQRCVGAVQQCRSLDSAYHRRAAATAGAPTGRPRCVACGR